MSKLATIQKWRNIIENSIMINNDESVFYTNKQLTHEIIEKSYSNGARLKLSRPVFQIEIDAGLDINYNGRKISFDERDEEDKAPGITLFIDAYFVIKKGADVWRVISKNFNPSEFVARHIAYSFYDCMSGGFPIHELRICRMLAKDSRINKEEYVYPCDEEHTKKTGRDYHNISDFLEETKDTEEKFKDKFDLLLNQFSFPMLSDGKNEAQ